MKLVLFFLLSLPVFAQEILPEYCKSDKVKDRKLCNEWKRVNSRIDDSASSGLMPEELYLAVIAKQAVEKKKCAEGILTEVEKKNCNQIEKDEQLNSLGRNPGIKAFGDEMIRCKSETLTAEEKKVCEDLKNFSSPSPYGYGFGLTGLGSGIGFDSRMYNCQMSDDGKEISCGDKVYELTGKTNDMSRMNPKSDLKEKSPSLNEVGEKSKARPE